MFDPDELKCLGSGRWTVPLLARMSAGAGAGGTRFAELLSGLEIARDSLVRTLAHAIECGWVVRNTGYGHPMRPEYFLTPKGKAAAAAAARMMAARQRLGLFPQALPRWALPIIVRLGGDWARFTSLRDDLAPVTARALSLNLQQMLGGGVIDRRLQGGFPPSALYGLAPPGRELLKTLG